MRIIGAAVGCLLVVAGCGGGGKQRADPRSTPQAVRVQALLGRLPDLPAGFSEQARGPWEPPFTPADGNCRSLFALVAGEPPKDGLSAAAAVTYPGDAAGSVAAVSVAVYQDGGSARQLAAIQGAMTGCVAAADSTPGGGNWLGSSELRIAEADKIEMGKSGADKSAAGTGTDKSAAGTGAGKSGAGASGTGWVGRRLSGRVGGYPYEMHLVVMRQGRAIVTLLHGGMSAPDVRRTQQLARLLSAKVGTLDL